MKALLYRPAPKRSVAVAFAAAAAIHVSALAFPPSRHGAVITPGADISDIVEVESISVDPEPQPPQIEMPEPHQLQEDEFAESPQLTPNRVTKPTMPIRANRVAMPKTESRIGKPFAVLAPKPDYPYVARQHHITGSGTVLLDVNPVTGSVIHASLSESTGSPILDNSAVSAFRRWRFRNGTHSPVKVPFTFTMFGAQL